MTFVTDIKSRLRHFSTIALAAGAAIQGIWLAFPEDLKSSLGPDAVYWVSRVTAAVMLWGLVGKFIVQGDGKDDAR